MSAIDYTNPLHAASLFIDRLKTADGPRMVTLADTDSIVAFDEMILREADLDLDARLLVDTLDFYALSFARLGINRFMARSIFSDGVAHGLALAAGLRGEVPS